MNRIGVDEIRSYECAQKSEQKVKQKKSEKENERKRMKKRKRKDPRDLLDSIMRIIDRIK